MGTVLVFRREYDVAGLVADKVFVVWRNQEELALPEAPCSTVVRQVEVPASPLLHMDSVAQECYSLATVTNVLA